MNFIDPHIHIAARTTDDIERMAKMGCVVVGEPAFWMGYNRSGVNSFYDYFRQLTEWEPKRTANYGIRHYAWMGINAKEAEDVGFSREVIAVLPEFLDRPTVLGVGEVGLHKCTRNEVTTLLSLIELAVERGEQLLFHTPHLEDKYLGTRMILDILREDRRIDPNHPPRARRRLLGRHHAVPHHQSHPRAGRRHGRALRPGPHPSKQLSRLGPFRSAGRAGLHAGAAPPRPPGVAGATGGLREPAEVHAAERAL